MIFYKNKKQHKKPKEENLVFSIFADGMVSGVDDSLAKPNQCKSVFNLICSDGALKTGLGFKDLEVPTSLDDLSDVVSFDFSKLTEISNMWMVRWFDDYYEEYTYQILISDKKVLHYISLVEEYDGMIWPVNGTLTSEPIYACQYRLSEKDYTLIFTDKELLYISANSAGKTSKLPPIISCAVHYDKFFGITNKNRNELIYTSNLNLISWSDEEKSTLEFLDDRGMFNKLVAFNDYVYLFREYGITRLSIYSSKSDFSITHQYTSSSKIYENSVCVCGDKVLFATRMGLFSFNGSSVSPIAEKYDLFLKNLNNDHCSSACLDGKYYLATKCDFGDDEKVGCEAGEHVNNVLFEYDIQHDVLNVYRGVDIRGLLAVNTPFMNKLCANFNHEFKLHIGQLTTDGMTFGADNFACWKSFVTDLNFRSKRKKIKEIVLKTKFDCEVEIVSDEEAKTYKFCGNDKQQRQIVSIYGENFQFVFKTNSAECDIEKPMIVFDVIS